MNADNYPARQEDVHVSSASPRVTGKTEIIFIRLSRFRACSETHVHESTISGGPSPWAL